MTDAEFNRISLFVKNKYGIDLTQKREILTGRLENTVRKNGWSSYSAYMNAVESDITGELEKELVNLLTTNHTYFMRESEHFDYMRKVVLPWLTNKEKNSKDLRIWCAASSSGEEPYAIAMLLLDYFGFEHQYWDTKVLATDISTDVLQTALRGVYSKDQVMSIPDRWRRRFFKPSADGELYSVTDELKNEVIFRQFNLMEMFPFRRKMHVIFLRNVMIYFDKKDKSDLLRRIYELLEPGGYLFLGRTETIERGNIPFEMVEPSIFRKPEVK